jgi:hypothetical protein
MQVRKLIFAVTATLNSKGDLTLHLSAGTITFHTAKENKNVSKIQTATACSQTQSSASAYTIAGGTGAYQGISGSGRATLDNTFVEQVVNGDCSSAFAAVQSLITASGSVARP